MSSIGRLLLALALSAAVWAAMHHFLGYAVAHGVVTGCALLGVIYCAALRLRATTSEFRRGAFVAGTFLLTLVLEGLPAFFPALSTDVVEACRFALFILIAATIPREQWTQPVRFRAPAPRDEGAAS